MGLYRSSEDQIRDDSFYDQLANLIERVKLAILREGFDQDFTDQFLGTIRSACEQLGSSDSIRVAIQQKIQETEKLQAILRNLLKEAESLQASTTQLVTETEWGKIIKELEETFRHNPKKGTAEWLKAYAKALLNWDLDRCRKLVDWGFSIVERGLPFPLEETELPVLLHQGTQALQSKDYRNALTMLEHLVPISWSGDSQSPLDPISQAQILLLIGRIHLYQNDNPEQAFEKFARADELVPNDGRIQAAFGDYYRAPRQNDERQARVHYQKSIRLSREEPDGYLGMGFLADHQKLWDEALNWYRQAVAAAVAKFSPANEPAGDASQRALSYLMEIVDLENKDKNDYCTSVSARLLGILFESLRKTVEAAEAYYQSGQIFMQFGEIQAAIDLFARANNLDERSALSYWGLADAWRIRSASDEEGLKKSQEFWEKGFAISQPDAAHSWVYVTRALINKQRTQVAGIEKQTLLWEGISFLERAILLEDAEAYRWIHLSDFYGDLLLRYNALYASERALELNPDNILSLQKQSLALISLGRLIETEALINRILAQDPENAAARWLKAYVLYCRGEFESAQKILDGILSKVSLLQSVNLLPLQAVLHEMLSQPQLAAQDYKLIWEHRDHLDYEPSVAWAEYRLGKVGEAISRLDRLGHDPKQAGTAHRNLGLIYMETGDLARGEQELIQGVDLAVNILELDELLNVDIYLLEAALQKSSFGVEAGQVLQKIKEKIKNRRVELDQPLPVQEQVLKAAEKELLEAFEKSDRDNWTWVGALAGLARLDTTTGRLELAASRYRTLQKQDSMLANSRFPEVSLGLAKVAKKYAQLGLQVAEQGDLPETIANFRESLGLRKQAGIEGGVLDLVSESADLITSSEQYEVLKKAITELEGNVLA